MKSDIQPLPQRIADLFIFMKVGNHANESFDKIIKRKMRERDEAGSIFWGYGGSLCHPISQVQPFMRTNVEAAQGGVYLVMSECDSRADPEIFPAEEYSTDGVDWHKLPKGVQVLGSKYAFILEEIKPGDFMVDLNDYEVGIGPSRGKSAGAYVQGRVDKGCFVRSPAAVRPVPIATKLVPIQMTAKLKEPYAVLLR